MRLVPVLSRAPANAHLGTQSAEAPRNVPLQNQSPLDLRRPEVGLPRCQEIMPHSLAPIPHPPHKGSPWNAHLQRGPQNSLSCRENLQLLEL